MFTNLATVFVAGFVRVFAAGFQSRNVNTGRIKSAAATSFLIAVSEGSIIIKIAVDHSIPALMTYGLAGSCAIIAAMKLHDHLHGK
jgi:hypothetical protein